MKIYAPMKNANGVYASVRFVDGVGETDNPKLIKWFEQNGYSLEKCDFPIQSSVEKCDFTTEEQSELEDEIMGYGEPKIPNLDDMNPNQIREWAKSNGYGSIIRNTRSKDKLIELIRG